MNYDVNSYMEAWEAAVSDKSFEDYFIRRIDVPAYCKEDRLECLRNCEENLCGMYGTNWACPPHMDIDPQGLYEDSEYVLLVRRTFCLDVKDKEIVDATGEAMQRAIRLMVVKLRQNGMDCIGFADGGCKYCGVCACPEPCRFPDMEVPSISALGLDLGKYMGSVGEHFSFSDDCITLYGLIFIKKKD